MTDNAIANRNSKKKALRKSGEGIAQMIVAVEHEIEERVREKPQQSLLAAFFSGLALSFFLKRRK